MSYFDSKYEKGITNSQVVSEEGKYALDATQNNPEVKGSLRNELNDKLSKSELKKHGLELTSYLSDATGEDKLNFWFKVATLSIPSRYAEAQLLGKLVALGASDGIVRYIEYAAKVKQQDAFGSPARMELIAIRRSSFSLEWLKMIQVCNDAENGAKFEIWCQNAITYNRYYSIPTFCIESVDVNTSLKLISDLPESITAINCVDAIII